MEKISVITCTGGRQTAFSLCQHYLYRQTYKGPIEWIIVDDFQPATIYHVPPSNIKIKYVRGPTAWRQGYNTQRDNMNAGLNQVTGDIIAVMEDDDYFAPTYLEESAKMLSLGKAVGDTLSRYYHVTAGYKQMNNNEHSSLSSTIFVKELLPYLDAAVNCGEFYFDVRFWNSLKTARIPRVFYTDNGLFCGMKGLPGKAGLTESHKGKDFMYDNQNVLEKWIGANDSAIYRKIGATNRPGAAGSQSTNGVKATSVRM